MRETAKPFRFHELRSSTRRPGRSALGRSALGAFATAWALLVIMLIPTSAAADGTLRADRIAWRDLQYKASKLFITAEAQVSLDVQGEEIELLLESEALGRESETRIWIEPATARTLRERKLKMHRDAGLRTYDYLADHAVKVRYHERPVAEGAEPLETWREKSRERQNFVESGAPPASVTTPSALLYLLGAAPLERQGDVLEATLFSDERLVRARAEVVAVEAFDGEIENLAGGAVEPGPALRIQLTARDAAGGATDLDLLGLEGDLEILIDRRHRLPLAIRGGMPVLGRVDVRLQAARLR